jgi:hypothetical protein
MAAYVRPPAPEKAPRKKRPSEPAAPVASPASPLSEDEAERLANLFAAAADSDEKK